MHHIDPYVREVSQLPDMISREKILTTILEPLKSVNRLKLSIFDVQLSEVIKRGDLRSNDERFRAAKQMELKGLIEKGTWELVCKSEVPKNVNILGGRFVPAIKDGVMKDEVWKARFLVRGYRGKLKCFLCTILPHQGNTPHEF